MSSSLGLGAIASIELRLGCQMTFAQKPGNCQLCIVGGRQRLRAAEIPFAWNTACRPEGLDTADLKAAENLLATLS
jgi:hypothetical protein